MYHSKMTLTFEFDFKGIVAVPGPTLTCCEFTSMGPSLAPDLV